MPSSGELYRVLEVEPTVTTDEITAAYRRKALQVHPDRTGGTTTAQFQLVQQAKEILSNPSSRLLYDAVGRRGMMAGSQVFQDPREADPMVIFVVSCISLLMNVCLLIFTALVVANIDRGLGYRWVVVFIPLWIIYVPFVVGALVAMCYSVRSRLVAGFFVSLFPLCGIVAVVLLALALDGTVGWAAMFYFDFAVMALFILRRLPNLLPSTTKEEILSAGVVEEDLGASAALAVIYVCHVVTRLLVPSLVLVWLVLLYLRIVVSGYDQFSLYAVFAPLYAAIVVQGMAVTVQTLALASMVMSEVPIVASCCRVVCGTVVFVFFVGYTPMLVSIKAQREINDMSKGPSAAVCAIVAFIVVGIAVLTSCCGSCAMCFASRVATNQEEPSPKV